MPDKKLPTYIKFTNLNWKPGESSFNKNYLFNYKLAGPQKILIHSQRGISTYHNKYRNKPRAHHSTTHHSLVECTNTRFNLWERWTVKDALVGANDSHWPLNISHRKKCNWCALGHFYLLPSCGHNTIFPHYWYVSPSFSLPVHRDGH